MSPCRIAAAAAATAVVAAGVVTSSASAGAGDKTLRQTFLAAATLCQKTAAGTEARHLRPFATTILADCAALESAFGGAGTTARAARAAITTQEAAANAAIAAACPPPASPQTGTTCATAVRVNTATLGALHAQRRAANRTYWATIDGARTVFWAEINSLRTHHT